MTAKALGCLLAVGIIQASSWSLTAQERVGAGGSSPTKAASASDALLVQPNNVVYEGSFRLPVGVFPGASVTAPAQVPLATFGVGGGVLGFNPDRNSLYVVGDSQGQLVAEVSIPEIRKGTVASLATATLLQPFADPKENHQIDGNTANAVRVGGLLPYQGKLHFTEFAYYDGRGGQTKSQYVSGLDLSIIGDVTGPVGTSAPFEGLVSGYMGLIPPAWQAALGGPALIGQCCIPIISRTSYGPGVFSFDPATVGVTTPVRVTPLAYYPSTHPNLGAWASKSPIYNGTQSMGGVVFPVDTRSVLFFGTTGDHFCYGPSTTDPALEGQHVPAFPQQVWCYDPTAQTTGPHGFPYNYVVWAFDAVDLAKVKAGGMRPWDVKPYATWKFAMPYDTLSNGFPIATIGGVTYDPATGRIFIAQEFADGTQPIIHVFTIQKTP